MPRQPKNSLNFTKAGIERLKTPKSGGLWVVDSRTLGLTLRVGASGLRTFYWYRAVAGRPERVRLGRYEDLSIEQARKRATDLNSELGKGINPAERVRHNRDVITLADLFALWLARAKQEKKTWIEDQRIYDVHLATWKTRKLTAIKPSDVAALHARIGGDTPIMANRILSLLSAMFNAAKRDYAFEGANPCANVRRFTERSRDRFLQPAELKPFFEALATDVSEIFRDYVLVSLLSGARRSNVLAMRWVDVDLTRGTWTIPAELSKNAMTMLIHLSPQAIDVLKGRIDRCGDSSFVFPSYGKSGHFADPKRGWQRLLERAGISNLRIHDLRRTLASWMTMDGTSLPIVGKVLGHKSASATQIYARLSLSSVTQAVDAASVAMLTAGGVNGAEPSEGTNDGEKNKAK